MRSSSTRAAPDGRCHFPPETSPMIKALAIKELRETWGIAAVAVALYLALVSNLIGMGWFSWMPLMRDGPFEVPFVGTTFLTAFTCVSVPLALALGFRQSAWEGVQGTYLFLLHRPVSRRVIFGTKLVTGLVLLLGCAAVPILLYAWWAATPGHHPSPFEWSMTGPSWRLWSALPLLYLGAFHSGLRPARWVGTRLLPLVACGLGVVVVVFVPWWWLGLPMAVLMIGALVANIQHVGSVR